MRLILRLNQVLSAHAHDLVARCEDPEKMLHQAIREMEAALTEATGNAAQAIAGERLLARRATRHHQLAEQLSSRARDALAAGNESVGREVLRQRQAELRLARMLADEHAAAVQANASLVRALEQLQAQLREARARLLLLEARQRATAARRHLFGARSSVGDFSVHRRRFEEFAVRVDFAEAEAAALGELADDFDERFLREDQASAYDAAVEQELATLRAKMSGGGSR